MVLSTSAKIIRFEQYRRFQDPHFGELRELQVFKYLERDKAEIELIVKWRYDRFERWWPTVSQRGMHAPRVIIARRGASNIEPIALDLEQFVLAHPKHEDVKLVRVSARALRRFKAGDSGWYEATPTPSTDLSLYQIR